MRVLKVVVLFSLFASGCIDSHHDSKGDSDGGPFSLPESGAVDSAKTIWGRMDGSFSILDARANADRFSISTTSRGPVCGNNIKEEGEICDGTDLGGATCTTPTLGLVGTIGCAPDCMNYEGSCYSSICGDNAKNEWESCDGSDLAGESCYSLTGQPGPLYCTDDCRFDTSMCYDGLSVIDDGGVDDESRRPVSGRCARNTGARCESDEDCVPGGCDGELCYNPNFGQIATSCDCTAPANLACGCVNGVCTWWTVDSASGMYGM